MFYNKESAAGEKLSDTKGKPNRFPSAIQDLLLSVNSKALHVLTGKNGGNSVSHSRFILTNNPASVIEFLNDAITFVY